MSVEVKDDACGQRKSKGLDWIDSCRHGCVNAMSIYSVFHFLSRANGGEEQSPEGSSACSQWVDCLRNVCLVSPQEGSSTLLVLDMKQVASCLRKKVCCMGKPWVGQKEASCLGQ